MEVLLTKYFVVFIDHVPADSILIASTQTIAASLAEHGRTAAIVSGDPAGLVPFER